MLSEKDFKPDPVEGYPPEQGMAEARAQKPLEYDVHDMDEFSDLVEEHQICMGMHDACVVGGKIKKSEKYLRKARRFNKLAWDKFFTAYPDANPDVGYRYNSRSKIVKELRSGFGLNHLLGQE